jgi:organic hydroperoxide reductase OsmC/OhrA
MSIEKVLYRVHAKATGGRDGRVLSSDAALDVKLTRPSELGGTEAWEQILSNYLPQVIPRAFYLR